MRRDFDYVLFSDYQADMAEATQGAVAAIAAIREERNQARRLLAYVVAATGRVSIPESLLQDKPPTLIQEYDPANMAYVLRTKG